MSSSLAAISIFIGSTEPAFWAGVSGGAAHGAGDLLSLPRPFWGGDLPALRAPQRLRLTSTAAKEEGHVV
jgi:hypothetical protein